MKNFSTFFHFFVLVSLLPKIKGDLKNATENKNASQLLLENNFSKAQNKSTNITKNANKTHVSEIKTTRHQGKRIMTIAAKGNEKVPTNFSLDMDRKSRDTKITMTEMRKECISCYGSGLSVSDDYCYKGIVRTTKKCDILEDCYTELHPHYIRRGCVLPSSINRTFICKCPLCNDKPSDDLTYYTYNTISDWSFDNARINLPLMGVDLLCKVCKTSGDNAAFDAKCIRGKDADLMQCGPNQLCFINIDHQSEYISRGCIDQPAYNVLYFVCDEPKCNNKTFDNPRRTIPEIRFKTSDFVSLTATTSAGGQAMKSLCTITLINTFILNFLQLVIFDI